MAKITKEIKNNKWLIAIFILALFFRLYNLSKVPYALDGDEAAFGYYGYSILNNLSDEYGNKLPLYFSSIGDYKYPVYAYLTTIPVFLFGLSEFSARFISAFSGSILVLIVYGLVLKLTNKKELSLVAAFIMSFSPFGIMFSRGAYESNLSMMFVSLGIYLLIKYYDSVNFKLMYYSLVPFFLAVFTYSSARAFLILFIPFAVLYIYLSSKKIDRVKFKNVIFIAVLITSLSAATFLDPRSLVRAKSVAIFNDPLNIRSLDEQILEDGRHNPGNFLALTRIFHNKPVVYSLNFIRRYFEHFNPVYLFVDSNKALNKYSISGVGLFYFFEFFTIIFGITKLIEVSKKLSIIPIWILVSVIPSATTIETPNPIRMLTGLPAWIILSAIGIYSLSKYFTKYIKIYYLTIGLLFVIGSSYFWHQYFIHDVTHEPWYTDGGVKEMVIESTKLSSSFENVVIPQDPYMFFLFYNKILPQDFIKESIIKPERYGEWERVDKIGKFIFSMPTNCPKIGREHVLYVCKGGDVPLNGVVHKTIYFNDKVTVAFSLIEFIPYSTIKKVDLPVGLNWMAETDKSYKESLLDPTTQRYW